MRVLLIDDDFDCLSSLEEFLSMTGYCCDTYLDPCRAMEEYEKEAHDVVITDVKMPGMDGYEVLKKVQGLNPRGKVIMISAYDEEPGEGVKPFAYMNKPLDLEGLMLILKEIETL